MAVIAGKLAIIALVALGATASVPAQSTVFCLGKRATIVGTPGDDRIHGTARHDVIAGLGGNDRIDQLLGGDTVCGGEGNDNISTGQSESEQEEVRYPPPVVSGDAGDDVVTADDSGYGPDTVVSFEEAPGPVLVNLTSRLATGWGNDRFVNRIRVVKGSAYADSITGDDSYNWLYGGPGDDRLFGRNASDTLDGGAGDDTLDGGKHRSLEPHEDAGDAAIYVAAPHGVVVDLASRRATGWGNDRLVGIEFVQGSGHADRLLGGPHFDMLSGLAGNDVILGGPSGDWILGGAGDDLLVGRGGGDTLRGDGGNDHLRGGPGLDELAGNGGRDRLEGGPGNDSLGENDPGDDKIDGGAGEDSVSYLFAPRVVASLVNGRASGWGQDRLTGIEDLFGSLHADRITGDQHSNRIYGRGGDDFISGEGGNDDLAGEEGHDHILGGTGRDRLDGGPGTDLLDGGMGRDRCFGGELQVACW